MRHTHKLVLLILSLIIGLALTVGIGVTGGAALAWYFVVVGVVGVAAACSAVVAMLSSPHRDHALLEPVRSDES